MELNFERLAAQKGFTPSFKNRKFDAGSVIELKDLRAGSFTQNGSEVPNDKLEVQIGGEAFSMPLREFLKMTPTSGELYKHEAGAEKATLPAAVKIVSSTDREDRDGAKVYPVQAYKAFDAQIKANAGIDWTGLVASGVKDDNELSPVQNYTIEIQ